ncbi:EutN/CcmL family microcompartment protein [Myxococcota bacterium]|nr:EutN/CcmL family microcompartment protein [Myxococcota bacterium]MBU1380234.1 EutN/CcmL family microcompartment protein [Myxococcota bacterium]MBU1499100.1 EutN/CcmL family microcompartment protein [Myxococcota bacterium]
MITGRVIGQVNATIKVETLTGYRMFVVQGVDENLNPIGKPFVALDGIACAGMGDVVTITTKRDAALALGDIPPIDACIVGFVDVSTVSDKNGNLNTYKP